jgi:isopentenyldiphosphate isomerase
MINQSNTKDEMVIIVDKDDNFVKVANRKEMRLKNLTHRSTSIFVNKGDKFLVQKRSMMKEFCPGFLDLTVGGVVAEGEDNITEVIIVNKVRNPRII